MYLAVGSYSFDPGSVFISQRESAEFSETGRLASKTRTLSCRGTLQAASQSAMKTKIQQFEAALALPYRDVILYMDDGNESATVLKNAGSLTGVQLIEGPSYPSTEGAENALFRTWEATWQAKYLFDVSNLPLTFAVTFEETLEIDGGGAEYVHKPNKYGVWQKQLNYPMRPWTATQSGTAIGLRGYPLVPPPIFPQALKYTEPRVSRKGPRQEGFGLRDYTISWVWQFESVTPLNAYPHHWLDTRFVRTP